MKSALVIGGVVTALAIGFTVPMGPAQNGPDGRMAAVPMLGASVAEAQAAPAAGRHVMEGKVTKVDPKRGWIDVKTPEGSMKLHFPPPALDGVKAGDSVSVELGMTTAAADRMPKTK